MVRRIGRNFRKLNRACFPVTPGGFPIQTDIQQDISVFILNNQMIGFVFDLRI